VCLIVSASFLVVDAAVQGDVDAEGQESHGVLRARYATSRSPFGCKGTSPIRWALTLCRLTSYKSQSARLIWQIVLQHGLSNPYRTVPTVAFGCFSAKKDGFDSIDKQRRV
jgi:hypothetical protein